MAAYLAYSAGRSIFLNSCCPTLNGAHGVLDFYAHQCLFLLDVLES